MGAADRAVDRLAARQHHALARRQAVEVGFSHDMIRYRLATGAWQRTEFDHVYRVGAHEPTWRHRLWGAQLWTWPDGLIGGRAAAALYGLDRCPPTPVELLLPLHAKHRAPRGVRVRRSAYPAGVVDFDGLRATDPETTLLAVARAVHGDVLEDVLESAFDLGVTNEQRLLLAIGTRPGAGPIRRILAARSPGRARQSRLEGELTRLVRRELGLDLVRQLEIRTSSGHYFADFAIPELRVAIETDGFGKLRTKSGKQAFLERATDLAVAGWSLLHFSWDDVTKRPRYVLDTLRQARVARIG